MHITVKDLLAVKLKKTQSIEERKKVRGMTLHMQGLLPLGLGGCVYVIFVCLRVHVYYQREYRVAFSITLHFTLFHLFISWLSWDLLFFF